MKYTKIPYSYDWKQIISSVNDDEDYNTMKIEQDMRSLIDNPNTVWVEVGDNSKMIADGLYVIDFENYLYTIIYNGEVVLSFS